MFCNNTPLPMPMNTTSSPPSSGGAAGLSRPATDAESSAPTSLDARLAGNPDGLPQRHRRGAGEGTLRIGVATLGSSPSGTAMPHRDPLPQVDPALAIGLPAAHRQVTGAAMALSQAELRLPAIYTPLADPAGREQHGRHQEALAQALAELKAQPRADGLDFRNLVAQELPDLLEKAGFTAGIYAARSSEVGGYGRYLLHSDADLKERFCLQIFAFDPRQKTPIHNHPNECASYIAQGALMERLYELPETAAADGHAGQVTKRQKNQRPQTSWAGFDSAELQVPHSLKNHGGSMAVSVHLYRDMDGVSQGQQVAAADKFERFKP